MKAILLDLYKEGYPGREKLAEEVGLSAKTIDRYLEEMETRGMIEKTGRSSFHTLRAHVEGSRGIREEKEVANSQWYLVLTRSHKLLRILTQVSVIRILGAAIILRLFKSGSIHG